MHRHCLQWKAEAAPCQPSLASTCIHGLGGIAGASRGLCARGRAACAALPRYVRDFVAAQRGRRALFRGNIQKLVDAVADFSCAGGALASSGRHRSDDANRSIFNTGHGVFWQSLARRDGRTCGLISIRKTSTFSRTSLARFTGRAAEAIKTFALRWGISLIPAGLILFALGFWVQWRRSVGNFAPSDVDQTKAHPK